MDIPVNWLAILVATVASFALGAIWYGPMFGKAWMKGMGLTEEDMKGGVAKAYIVTFVFGIVTAYAFSVVVYFVDAHTWQQGAKWGVLLWVGFLFSVKISDAMFGRAKMSAVLIDSGYRLVWMVITGVILAIWRTHAA